MAFNQNGNIGYVVRKGTDADGQIDYTLFIIPLMVVKPGYN